MKVKYVGPTIGAMTLTSGKVYDVLGIEEGMLRIADDDINEPGGYLYDPVEPGDISGKQTGKWEIVEDDSNESLKKFINGQLNIKSKVDT